MDGWGQARVFGRSPPAGVVGCVVRPGPYGLVEDGQGRVAIGAVEGEETAAQAVRREALEECGLIVRTARRVARAAQLVTLATLPNTIWEPAACPLCTRGVPLTPRGP